MLSSESREENTFTTVIFVQIRLQFGDYVVVTAVFSDLRNVLQSVCESKIQFPIASVNVFLSRAARKRLIDLYAPYI